MLALFSAALSGLPALAAAAVLFPEYRALRHLHHLPGVLTRLALLPLSAGISLDALLMRLTAQTRIRLRVPPASLRPAGSVLSGMLLFAAAFYSIHALSALLPVSALWIAAPYIRPALARPTIARIPLSPEELSQVRSFAEGMYFSSCSSSSSPAPIRMLCEAAGCMLRLIEPDEAARHIQSYFAQYQAGDSSLATAAEQAAMLACAQYLRERMSDCDAALRPLPSEIETFVLSMPLPQANSRLGAFLCAARTEDSAAYRPSEKMQQTDAPLDALFLPLAPARDMPAHSLTLALTHPHSFVCQLRTDASQKQEKAANTPGCFLAAAAAALAHPFYALLLRSPVAAPYSALLAM